MELYKIEFEGGKTFYGITDKPLSKVKLAHRLCYNNYFCNCSLYKYMRKQEVGDFNLELVESGIHLSVVTNKLIMMRQAYDSDLNECRAKMLLNKKQDVKKNSQCCVCGEIPKENFSSCKPFVLKFD